MDSKMFTETPVDCSKALFQRINPGSSSEEKNAAFLEIMDLFDVLNTRPTKTGQYILNSFNYKAVSHKELKQQEKYHSVLINLVKSFYNFGMENKFDKTKQQTIIEISAETIKLMMDKSLTPKMIVHNITSYLVKQTLNQPPICRQIYNLDDVKKIMVFLTQNVFSRLMLYQKIFVSNKNMTLNTYKMFDRKMPYNLTLGHGKAIRNPLEIPELRKYQLKDDEIYVNDDELVKIMESGNFSGYTKQQIEKLKGRWEIVQKQLKIQAILDREIGNVKEEFQEKLKELNQFIEAEK